MPGSSGTRSSQGRFEAGEEAGRLPARAGVPVAGSSTTIGVRTTRPSARSAASETIRWRRASASSGGVGPGPARLGLGVGEDQVLPLRRAPVGPGPRRGVVGDQHHGVRAAIEPSASSSSQPVGGATVGTASTPSRSNAAADSFAASVSSAGRRRASAAVSGSAYPRPRTVCQLEALLTCASQRAAFARSVGRAGRPPGRAGRAARGVGDPVGEGAAGAEALGRLLAEGQRGVVRPRRSPPRRSRPGRPAW